MPLTELHMFHGLADELVPFLNSQIPYDSFLSNGAEVVYLETVPNGMVVIAVLQSPFYLELILWRKRCIRSTNREISMKI